MRSNRHRRACIFQTSLDPRLPGIEIRPLQKEDGIWVIIIRIRRSWLAPHRVTFRDHSKFYGRNAGGKYALDVDELRTAFTLSENVSDRIRNFRADRISRVYGRETPIPLRQGGVAVFHLLPLSAFTQRETIAPSRFEDPKIMIPPWGGAAQEWRINLDGFATFSSPNEDGSRAYTQMFRSGAIEAATVLGAGEKMFINGTRFEVNTVQLLTQFLKMAQGLDIEFPLFIFLSLVGVAGCRLEGRSMRIEAHPLTEDMVMLPEVIAEEVAVPPEQILRPIFDMVWNAFGLRHSLNYDHEGKWNPT